jgi:hypothetical protein
LGTIRGFSVNVGGNPSTVVFAASTGLAAASGWGAAAAWSSPATQIYCQKKNDHHKGYYNYNYCSWHKKENLMGEI